MVTVTMHWLLKRRQVRLFQLVACLVFLSGINAASDSGIFVKGKASDDQVQKCQQYVMSARLLRYHKYQKTQHNRTGQGENGGKVVLTRKQRLRAWDLFAQEGINIVASDIIALDRALPDFRSDQ